MARQVAEDTMNEKSTTLRERMCEQLRQARLRALNERDDPYFMPTKWQVLYTDADDHLMPAPALISGSHGNDVNGEAVEDDNDDDGLDQGEEDKVWPSQRAGQAQTTPRSARAIRPARSAGLTPPKKGRFKIISTPYIVYMLSDQEIREDLNTLSPS